jgi:DNA-binding MarR family transcriptional regulator
MPKQVYDIRSFTHITPSANRLKAISPELVEKASHACKNVGLTLNQFIFLCVMLEQPNTSIQEAKSKLFKEYVTVANLASKLVKLGFLTPENLPHARYKRRVYYSLTPSGRNVTTQLKATITVLINQQLCQS